MSAVEINSNGLSCATCSETCRERGLKGCIVEPLNRQMRQVLTLNPGLISDGEGAFV